MSNLQYQTIFPLSTVKSCILFPLVVQFILFDLFAWKSKSSHSFKLQHLLEYLNSTSTFQVLFPLIVLVQPTVIYILLCPCCVFLLKLSSFTLWLFQDLYISDPAPCIQWKTRQCLGSLASNIIISYICY